MSDNNWPSRCVAAGPVPGRVPDLAHRLWQATARRSAVVVLLLLWQLWAMSAHSIFFPPPLRILSDAGRLWLSGPANHFYMTEGVFRDVLPSIGRMAAGWAIAVLVGTSTGILIGRSRFVSDLAFPAIEFLRSLPSPALIPVFLIFLGTGSEMRIILIAFGSIWPILLNTIDAMLTIDAVQIDLARVLKLPLRARLFRVMLPSALPKIFAGMRIALAISLILMVVSELVASTSGIGNRIANAQEIFRFTDMWAGIVLLGLVGLLLDGLFSTVEARILNWHRQARQRA